MIPNRKEIVWQIAIMHELYPKAKISELAAKLMLSPIFIINALDLGEQMEMFQRKRDKKGKVTEVLEMLLVIDWDAVNGEEFGKDNVRIQNEILRAIGSVNATENDIEDGMLQSWCRGLKPCEIEMALTLLEKQNIITSYELADPKDKKSVYKFYTLAVNIGKVWGTKQFKAKK